MNSHLDLDHVQQKQNGLALIEILPGHDAFDTIFSIIPAIAALMCVFFSLAIANYPNYILIKNGRAWLV